jgi:signal transduction histidine kinase
MADENVKKPQKDPVPRNSFQDWDHGSNQLQNDPLLEGLFRKAFDCLSCHAAMVEEHGTIIAVNQAWRESYSELSALEIKVVEGINYLDVCESSEQMQASGGKSFAIGLRAVLERKTDRFSMDYSSEKGKEISWLLGRVNGLDINGLRYAFILHQDISDYKTQSDESLSQYSQWPTLVETVKSLVSMLDLEELLNTILIKFSYLIRYNAAAVFTFEADEIILKAYQGPPLTNRSLTILSLHGRYPEIYQFVYEKNSFFIQNINLKPDLLDEIAELLQLDVENLLRFHSWLCLPLTVAETQMGVMVLAYHDESYYDHSALKMGELFANFAAIAIQNARLYELSKNSAILQERNRLAYELHDSIAQSLYSINLYAKAAQSALEIEKHEVASRHLKDLQRLSNEAVKDMRLMIFELNNQLLEEFGIARAIQARFEAIEAKQGIKTDLKLIGKLDLSHQVEREVFGIIQDLLIYIEKTTPTKALSISIEAGEKRVLIVISSDQFVDPHENDVDLVIARINRIRNRVRKLGGKLHFCHSGDKETKIRFNLEL